MQNVCLSILPPIITIAFAIWTKKIIPSLIDASAQQLANFFNASTDLMKVISRSCGYDDVRKFNFYDLSTIDYQIHQLTGIQYAGIQ
jgi:hypothetical protein